MITVPKPSLQFEDAGGGAAPLEKPVTVQVGEVKNGAGPLGPEKLAIFGLFPYRRLTSGASLEIWDDGAKAWKPDPGAIVGTLKSSQLAFKPGDPNPWSGIVVAAGGKDGAGQPQYAKTRSGYPIYSFRALFQSKDGTGPALSDPSDNLTFLSASDKNLMDIGPGDDEKPENATQARMLLKDTSRQTIGEVLIERNSPGAKVTVSNAAGASVILHPDGRIEIQPAAGKGLLVDGDLEAERITYRPGGGGAKVTL